jgi:nicotinamide mononucleotide adenylyltransferase
MTEKEPLVLPGAKEVDLDAVASLEEWEYQGLLSYARQWDHPMQNEWLAQIKEARGEKVEVEEQVESEVASDGTDFKGMKAAEVIAWVGDEKSKASEALEHFSSLEKPPVKLVKRLEEILEA